MVKLTCDEAYYCLLTDYCAPKGEHMPRLVEDFGSVATTDAGDDLYLVEVEKLAPLRTAPIATRRMVDRMIDHVGSVYTREFDARKADCKTNRQKLASYATLSRVADFSLELPATLRETLREVGMFAGNYTAVCDFHRQNIMMRGDTIVLNDVVVSADKLNRFHRSIYGSM